MAIQVDNTSTTTASATQISAEHICNGTETNGILIVAVQVTDSTLGDRRISSVTHNAEACTHLEICDSDDSNDGLRTEIWYRYNPTTGGMPDIVVTAGGKCTDLTFGAISLTGVSSSPTTETYYFDGSDVAASDPDEAWNNETNIDDGNTGTNTDPTDLGGETFNYIEIQGTNASSSGNISKVEIRLHDGSSWSGYQIVTPPSGGWTLAIVQALELRVSGIIPNEFNAYVYEDGNAGGDELKAFAFSLGNDQISRIDVRVTLEGLVEVAAKGSNTPPTLDITTIGSSSYAIDSLSSGESDGSKIVGAHSSIHKTDVGADTHAAQYVDAGGAGAQTMNYSDTDSDTRWVLSAVAVAIAEEAPTAIASKRLLVGHGR